MNPVKVRIREKLSTNRTGEYESYTVVRIVQVCTNRTCHATHATTRMYEPFVHHYFHHFMCTNRTCANRTCLRCTNRTHALAYFSTSFAQYDSYLYESYILHSHSLVRIVLLHCTNRTLYVYDSYSTNRTFRKTNFRNSKMFFILTFWASPSTRSLHEITLRS